MWKTHSHFATVSCHPKICENAIKFFEGWDINSDFTLVFSEKGRDFWLNFCLFSLFLRNYLHIRYFPEVSHLANFPEGPLPFRKPTPISQRVFQNLKVCEMGVGTVFNCTWKPKKSKKITKISKKHIQKLFKNYKILKNLNKKNKCTFQVISMPGDNDDN